MIYRGALSGLLGIMLIAFSLGSSVMLGFTFGYSDYIACSLAWKFDNEISMSGSGFVQCLDKLDLVDYPSLKIKNLRATVDKSDYTTPINILSDLRYNDQFIKKDFVRIYDYSTPLKMAAVSDILVSKKDNIIVLNYVQ